MDIGKFTGSALYNADKIAPGVKIEEIVAGFETREFDDGLKAVMLFESGMGVVLNPTRALVMTQAFGRESDNMIGQLIEVSRGMTMYGGKPTACVVVEPVNPVRLVTQSAAKPAIEQAERPAIGKVTTNDHEVETRIPRSAPPPDIYDGPDGDEEGIPF
jgi:hypothetical protein